MKIKLEEYKSVTIEDIMKVTGLPNLYVDQSKFSLARQKELLLKDALKNNLLHKVKKSHPIQYKITTVSTDKDLSILTAKEISEPRGFTSVLDLNVVPHKVIRENNKVVVEVRKEDIPNHVFPKPGPGYSYHVIGILAEEKCYKVGAIHDGNHKRIGSSYKFGFHNKVTLHILD